MAIPQIELGFNSPITQDLRNVPNTSGPTNVDGTAIGGNAITPPFDSGRAWKLATTTNGARVLLTTPIEETGVLAVGDSVYCMSEFVSGSVEPAVEFYACALQGSRDHTAAGWCAIGSGDGAMAGVQANSGAWTIVFIDNSSGTQAASNAGGGVYQSASPFKKYKVGFKLTLVSTTQVTVQIYVDGVAGATLTHNNAGGIGDINLKQFRAGNATGNPKGGTIEDYIGNVFVSSRAMPAQNDNILYKLPTSDGTAEWVTSGAGVGTYTEWDDALGSYSTADYNDTTSVTAAKKQVSGFASAGLVTGDIVRCVGLNAASSLNGSAVDATRQLGITANATDIEKDITFSGGIAALFSNGAQMRFFEKRGDASAWDYANVDSDTFYARQAADAAAREWRVYAFGKMIWYTAGKSDVAPRRPIRNFLVTR